MWTWTVARFGGQKPALLAGVAVWWAVVAGVAFTMPAPGTGGELPTLTPGSVGRVPVPDGGAWLMPIDRATYYEVERPSRSDDGDGPPQPDVDDAWAGWLLVHHRQAARVLDIDRAAVQVELLEPPNVGGRGWLHRDFLELLRTPDR